MHDVSMSRLCCHYGSFYRQIFCSCKSMKDDYLNEEKGWVQKWALILVELREKGRREK